MSIALGIPFRDVVAFVLGKGDVTFMFWLIVFVIVLLILGLFFFFCAVLHTSELHKKLISLTLLRIRFVPTLPSSLFAITLAGSTMRTIIICH